MTISLSSLKAYLDKVWYGTSEKEAWSSTNYKQQYYNTNSSKRWKKCTNPDRSMADRAYRVRALLVNYLKHATHNMSRLWQHNHKTTLLNAISRRSRMSLPCKFCGNYIEFDDNIVSKNGIRIPLNEWNHQIHDCPFSPYNNRSRTEEKGKSEQWQVINNLKEQVDSISKNLPNYELKLIVERREDI